MKKYRVYSYDLWGNEKDGYEVNDVFRTSFTVELPSDFTDLELIKALKNVEFLNKYLRNSRFEIEGDYEYIYVNYASIPVCELRFEAE